jgi:hypothetical protein
MRDLVRRLAEAAGLHVSEMEEGEEKVRVSVESH